VTDARLRHRRAVFGEVAVAARALPALTLYNDMQTDAFQILADPTRRVILETLRHGERPVGDVVERAGIHQSGVSRHLRILQEAGFVSMRPDGQRRLYSLRLDRFREVEEWLARYRRLWEARLDRFGAVIEARRKAARKGGRSKADDRKG
jgi:DNA-binding transcriptional ArsR family regulator